MKIYQVGGSVRDELLNIKSDDIDHAVVCNSFEEMVEYLAAQGYKIFQQKPEFGCVRACFPNSKLVADFTMCRKDGYYSDGRRPDNVSQGTLDDDLARRDFTVNSIAKDLETGELIDPFNGASDLKLMLLRPVGDPHDRMREDGLRILRAFRFAVTKGFSFSDDLESVLQDPEIYKYLDNITVERKHSELYKMFSNNTVQSIEMFNRYPRELLTAIFKDGLWLMPTNKRAKLH